MQLKANNLGPRDIIKNLHKYGLVSISSSYEATKMLLIEHMFKALIQHIYLGISVEKKCWPSITLCHLLFKMHCS